MAIANSDGSIILSTKVDESGIDAFFKKYSVGLGQTTTKTKQNTQSKKENTKETEKQQNAYEKLETKIKEQTAALQRMKAEYSSIILTEGKTSEAAQALSSKMATLSGILEENKAKLVGVEQEANDLVSSFSKVGNGAQESAEKPKNAYQQLEETIAEQKTRLEELRQEYASLKLTNQGNTTQAKKLKAEINNLSAEVAENEARIKSLGLTSSSVFKRMKLGLMALASYFIGIQTIFAAFRFSGEAGELVTQSEASVQRLVDIYGEAAQSVGDFIDANARAIGMSKVSAASFASVYGNLFSVWADQSTNAELTNRYLNMTAVVASKTGRTVQDVQERIRSGLLGNTEAIEDLGVFVNVKTIEMTDAFQRMANGQSWEQLDAYTQQQIRTMAILEQATAKYGSTVADTTATTRAQYQAAYEDFKNTWGQVVNTVLIPVLKILTQVFTIATKGLQVIAGLSGKTVDNSKLQENAIGGAVDNQKELTDAVKDTAKEQKSLIAGFDEAYKISQDSNSQGAIGGGIIGDIDIGGADIWGDYDNSFVDQINEDLAAIMGYVGFALAAIGIILICFGHIGWGIGFLIAGASIFSVSQAALSEGAEAEKVKNIMNGIIAGISLLALILGIILVATGGSLPLGIGLIIVGAAGLATEVALNWDAITNAVTSFIDNNTGLIIGVASAILVIGIILCLVGQITPLSIGLIVAGAGILAAEVALNFEETQNTIKKFFQDNAGLIVGVSIALIVLGVILLFTGVGIPLAIGLILAGGGALAATVALNWNFIVDKVKEVWEKVKGFWNAHIAPVFTAEWWKNLGKMVMNGLISGFEAGINGIIGMFEKMINWIVDGLNKISFDVPEWVPGIGGEKFGFNIPEVKFGRVSIPRLAAGTVVPPNKQFMAILGDNTREHEVVSPLSTIKQAVTEALFEVGYSQPIQITLFLDSDVVYDKMVEKNNENTIRTGENAFA